MTSSADQWVHPKINVSAVSEVTPGLNIIQQQRDFKEHSNMFEL